MTHNPKAFQYVSGAMWDMLGYKGNSRKWARRRSKKIVRILSDVDCHRDANTERMYKLAGGK